MKKSRFVTYDKARDFSLKIRLKNVNEWREYAKSGKKPKDVPAWPYGYYLDNGWISWGDFLGTDRISSSKRNFLNFADAKKYVHTLNLNGRREWMQFSKSGKKPFDIPVAANEVYKNQGWISWGDFLGTNGIATAKRRFRDFSDTRDFVRKLNLKNMSEWRAYVKSGKKLHDIPAWPREYYLDKGWEDWKDFLIQL